MKRIARKLISYTGLEVTKAPNKDDIALYLKLFGEESVKNRRFYNISAGGHFGFGGGFNHSCWTDVDVPFGGAKKFNPETDLEHDLLSVNSMPIESNTAELTYSQFSIEHITDQAAQKMFNEIHRILKPNGIFRVVAPNIELDYIAYNNHDKSYFFWVDFYSQEHVYKYHGYKYPLNQASFEQVFLSHFASNASTIHREGDHERVSDEEFKHVLNTMSMEDAFNYCTAKCNIEVQKRFRHNHINWWTHSKLERMLKKAGFKAVYHLIPNQSSSPVMRHNAYFGRLWNDVALFVEAVKE